MFREAFVRESFDFDFIYDWIIKKQALKARANQAASVVDQHHPKPPANKQPAPKNEHQSFNPNSQRVLMPSSALLDEDRDNAAKMHTDKKNDRQQTFASQLFHPAAREEAERSQHGRN